MALLAWRSPAVSSPGMHDDPSVQLLESSRRPNKEVSDSWPKVMLHFHPALCNALLPNTLPAPAGTAKTTPAQVGCQIATTSTPRDKYCHKASLLTRLKNDADLRVLRHLKRTSAGRPPVALAEGG